MEAREMLERMAETAWDKWSKGDSNLEDAIQAALRELAKEHYDDVGGWHTPCALGSMVFAIMELEL